VNKSQSFIVNMNVISLFKNMNVIFGYISIQFEGKNIIKYN